MSPLPSNHLAPLQLAPGVRIDGRYRLDKLLAEGGMGSVWVATNLVLENKVAIKVLHANMTTIEQAEARMLREARVAAQLGHRNIVQVFDFGHTPSGAPFIVMELLRGEDLGTRIDRLGRLSAVDAVRTMLAVASALSAAHAKGVVHRDLKPQNIYLAVDDSGEEIPKVVDFGIAKIHAPKHVPRLTIDGHVVGSPEYLSPEQARGQDDLDARADIWAFCVTLYECLTGEVPFQDTNYNRLLRRILEDEPTPITDYAAGDRRLWEIVHRGLAKARAERWQRMSDLGAALYEWLEATGAVRMSGLSFAPFEPSSPGIDILQAKDVGAPPGLAASAPEKVTSPDFAPPSAPASESFAAATNRPLARTGPDYVSRRRRRVLLVASACLLALGVAGLGLGWRPRPGGASGGA